MVDLSARPTGAPQWRDQGQAGSQREVCPSSLQLSNLRCVSHEVAGHRGLAGRGDGSVVMAEKLVLDNVMLVDGTGGPAVPRAQVAVDDGVIVSVGTTSSSRP